MEDIWGADKGTPAVLDATVHRLRKRLDETLRESALVSTVRGIGYRLESSSLEPGFAGAD
jgi:DNA-binding response OmpR family regulator